VNDEIDYKTNPLHGVSLKNVLTEIVNYYGFDILYAYLNINCFKTNPSIDSSVRFLKRTDWAREKVEAFYMYEYKNLPRATDEQFELSPRDRIVPAGQTPGEPAELSLEDAEQLREKREKRSAEYDRGSAKQYGARQDSGNSKHQNIYGAQKNDRELSSSTSTEDKAGVDPWGKWKK